MLDTSPPSHDVKTEGVNPPGSPDVTEAVANNGLDKLPRWLRKLQNESWQAEMLISGGAVFTLFGAYDLSGEIGTFAKYSTELPYDTFVSPVITIMGLTAFVLIVGFMVHLVLRGFWIGLIGLNYVYPEGIVRERLGFAGKFASSFRNASNNDFILRIDRYCSTIFALTFLSFFSITGFMSFITVMLFSANTILEFESKWISRGFRILWLVFSLFGLITLADFMLGGRIKRIRWFAPIYYPFYTVISVVTLSFIYRRLYYTVASNIGGLRLALVVAAPVGLLYMIGSIFDVSGTQLSWTLFPANSAYDSRDYFLSIEKEVVEASSLDVFINHAVRLEGPAFEKWKVANPDTKEEEFSELTAKQQMDIIQQLYVLKVDEKPMTDSSEWYMTRTIPDNNFMAMHRVILRKSIDLSYLHNGAHNLTVRIALDSSKVKSYKINSVDNNHGRIRFLLRRK